jgi:hypothetical protein
MRKSPSRQSAEPKAMTGISPFDVVLVMASRMAIRSVLVIVNRTL